MSEPINQLDPCSFCEYPTCESCMYGEVKIPDTQLKGSQDIVMIPINGWYEGKYYHEGRVVSVPAALKQQENPRVGKEDILPQIIKDLQARTEYGIKTYGQPLQTHNGRDALVDAYQEALDLAQFLCQLIMERGEATHDKE